MSPPPKLVPAPHAAVQGPVVVAVMDGVGLGPADGGNAWHAAHTPFLDHALATRPWVPLAAHGPAVGLASAQDMGNSEVGHNALGAGQIVDQGAKRVAQAIADRSLFAGASWRAVLARCGRGEAVGQTHTGGGGDGDGDDGGGARRAASTDGDAAAAGAAPPAPAGALHLIGLLSDGNVHSHVDHLLALIAEADSSGIRTLFVHVLLDGRDVGRTSALTYVARLEALLATINAKGTRHYRVASGGGRMRLTMDRYNADWAMVERGWRHHVHAQGRVFADLAAAVETLRQEAPGIGDQDLPGFVLAAPQGQRPNAPASCGPGCGPILDGDAVVLVNFRGDRMLELVDAFEAEAFAAFDRGRRPDIYLAGMTSYDGDTHRPRHFLVAPPRIDNTLGELLGRAGVRQLACAETQKFGHVTYFWNGNRSQPFDPALEEAVEVASLPAPFDGAPAMRAHEVVEATLAAMAQSRPRFVRLNLANGDMVGHTGNFAATVAAMTAVDAAMAKLAQGVEALGGALIVTADHGNAEDMVERDAAGQLRRDAHGAPVVKTSHSLNPVPCIFLLPPADAARFVTCPPEDAGLANVAATCACLLGLLPPDGLWRPSLLRATGG